MEKEEVITFFKECAILLAFSLSAFWIIITGVSLLPQLAEGVSDTNLLPLFYALGTVCFSVIIIYTGLKYLNVIGPNKKEDD